MRSAGAATTRSRQEHARLVSSCARCLRQLRHQSKRSTASRRSSDRRTAGLVLGRVLRNAGFRRIRGFFFVGGTQWRRAKKARRRLVGSELGMGKSPARFFPSAVKPARNGPRGSDLFREGHRRRRGGGEPPRTRNETSPTGSRPAEKRLSSSPPKLERGARQRQARPSGVWLTGPSCRSGGAGASRIGLGFSSN